MSEADKKDPVKYEIERIQTLDLVLGLIEGRLTAFPAVILETPSTPSTHGAQREAWQLLAAGVTHLKEGGPVIDIKDGKPVHAPGLLTTALSKASLRSSALAASLGIPAPRFEQMLLTATYDSGHDEAYFLCKRLVEATLEDTTKSEQMIRTKIAKAGGGGMISATGDAALDKIFDAIKKGSPSSLSQPTSNILSDAAAFALQDQMEKASMALTAAHLSSCEALLEDLAKLRGYSTKPGGPGKSKPGSYKL